MFDRLAPFRPGFTFLPALFLFLGLALLGCGGGGGGGGTSISQGTVGDRITGTVSIPASLWAGVSGRPLSKIPLPPTISENLSGTNGSPFAQAASGPLPVPGATVWIEDLPALGTIITDASGTFSFPEVPAGEHRVVSRFVTSSGKTFKTRSAPILLAGSGKEAQTGDQVLREAGKAVRGILRDPAGLPLPTGTLVQLRVWGESFSSEPGGGFVSPLLPNDESAVDLLIERSADIGNAPQTRSLQLLDLALAPVVECSVSSTESAGNGLAGRLSLTRNNAETDRADLGETIEARIIPAGLPAGLLEPVCEWSATTGSLTVDPAFPTIARWRVQETPGMASIAIRLTVPSLPGFIRIERPVMIGISAPTWADRTTPEVVRYAPEGGENGLSPVATLSIVFSKPLAATSVNAASIQVKNASGAISAGGFSLSRDGTTITHGLRLPPARRDTVFVLVSRGIRDLAGNPLSKPVFWSFEIEDTGFDAGPVAVLSDLPTASTASRIASITVGGNGVVLYKFAFDEGLWSAPAATDTPIAFSDLEAGPHTLAVLGANASGTWQTEPTWATWTINLPVPIAILASLPPALTNSSDVSIRVAGKDVVAYAYALDGDDWSTERSASDSLTLLGLSDGSHRLRVVGRDAAGNRQPTRMASSFSWTIDTTPPGARIEEVKPNPRSTAVSALTVFFSEAVSAVSTEAFHLQRGEAPLDLGGSVLTRTGTTTWSLEFAGGTGEPGSYTFSLIPSSIADLAGNPLPTGATTNWLVVAEASPAPTNLQLTPIGGNVIANTLNLTNINLQAQAEIAVGASVGGSAELLLDGTSFPTPVLDHSITATDTRVTFDLGAADPGSLQRLVPHGGTISVRLRDHNGGSVVSTVGNPVLTVRYTPLTASFTPLAGQISSWPAWAGLRLTLSAPVATSGLPLEPQNALIKRLSGSGASFSFELHPTGRGTPGLAIATAALLDAYGNPNPQAITLTVPLPGANGSDVLFRENGQDSVYILVPRTTLADGSIQPPFYMGKFPATAGGKSAAGPTWIKDASFQPDGDDTGHSAATLAAGKPWVTISWKSAKDACALAGSTLIGERQWLAVASDALSVTANWRGGIVRGTEEAGYGFYRGLTASTVARGQASTESQPTVATVEYRKKTLSNGATVWDLGGNVWQWVDGTQAAGTWYTGFQSSGWIETTSTAVTTPLLKVSLGTMSGSACGLGRIFNFSGDSPRVLLRGGRWDEAGNGGAFALRLNRGETDTGVGYGFRQARSVASFPALP